jgi:hypothetical protein
LGGFVLANHRANTAWLSSKPTKGNDCDDMVSLHFSMPSDYLENNQMILAQIYM